MSRQSLKYARTRVELQTIRNVRFGFPQRGRATLSGRGMALCLPLSAGHRSWADFTGSSI